MKTAHKLAALVGLTTVIVAFAVGTAQADPYTSGATSVSNSTPAAGGSDTVTADGFKPNSTANIYILSTPVLLGSTQSDANGVVTATVVIPSSFAAGSHHTLEVQGESATGAPITDSIAITLAGASSGSGLAQTGVRVAEISGTGLLLLALGVFLVFTFRRRRDVGTD